MLVFFILRGNWRPSNISKGILLTQYLIGRRRLAPAWDPDSDEDEDISRELSREMGRDREALYRQHAAEALFGSDLDDERSIAAIRGAVAGGKRVLSKEALASLEVVKVKDLKEADRSKFPSSMLSIPSDAF